MSSASRLLVRFLAESRTEEEAFCGVILVAAPLFFVSGDMGAHADTPRTFSWLHNAVANKNSRVQGARVEDIFGKLLLFWCKIATTCSVACMSLRFSGMLTFTAVRLFADGEQINRDLNKSLDSIRFGSNL